MRCCFGGDVDGVVDRITGDMAEVDKEGAVFEAGV